MQGHNDTVLSLHFLGKTNRGEPMQKFDLIVVGAGPGGYTAALKAAEGGLHTALIEKEFVGGTCVNFGCIPTKSLMYSMQMYHRALQGEHFGIETQGVKLDKNKVKEYVSLNVVATRQDIRNRLEKAGVTIIEGTAKLFPLKQLQVITKTGEELELTARKFIMACGAEPIIPDIPGMELEEVLTSRDLIGTIHENLESLVIIGGGVIGVECAKIIHGMGHDVTIIEKSDRILSPMDAEISEMIANSMKNDNISVITNSTVSEIKKLEDGKIEVFYEDEKSGKNSIKASHALVAIGRKPKLENIFALTCMPDLENGHIKINNHFKTSIDDVYVIGDLVSNIQLAHVAAAQGNVVVEHLLHKKKRTVMLSIVPSCLFIDLPIVPSCIYLYPEVASVGLTEAEAVEKGLDVRCGKYYLTKNFKAIMDPDAYGFIKVIFEKRSDVLVGAQMVCPRATDMIGEMATAIANGLTSRSLTYAMRAHPTYNEGIAKAVENSWENMEEAE